MISSARPARLADVARHAGVSVTTASVVINGKASGIPDTTQQRVLSSAEELGYRASSLARNLRMQRSMTLGFISDDIATMPFAGALIGGAQEAAWAADFVLIIVDTNGAPERDKQVIEELRHRQVDAFLYATGQHTVIAPPASLEGTPTVLLDARDERGRYTSVVPDETQGARTAVEYLIAAGHRRVGYLDNEAQIAATPLRREGYLQALRGAGIEPDDTLIEATVPHDRRLALEATVRLLDRPDRPTALFCFSDRAASGAYAAARQLGLKIPDDLSVVGFDNLELVADWVDPGLTTIQLPHREMGRWGVNRLVDLLTRTDGASVQYEMPCPLVERGSVASPSSGGRR